MYITGKTGSGKSSYIQQRVYAQWWKTRKNDNCCIIFLDPHGETVELLRKTDLAHRFRKRMVYVDPVLMKGYTPTLNPFECRETNPDLIELQAQNLVRVFEEMIPDAKLSPYMRALLKPCLHTVLSLRSSNLYDLQQFLNGKDERLLQQGLKSENPVYKQFFKSEFNSPYFNITKASIYTRIQSLLNSQVFNRMTWGTSTINLERCVRQGKIVLFNLSKGKIGEEISETLGRFIIAMIKTIALKRAGLPDEKRKKIYLVIDEADTFIRGNSLNVVLKETRKYGLHLILITQNMVNGKEQEQLRRNLMNNTNVKVIGANGITTLKPLSQETGIKLNQLQSLRFHEFWIKYGPFKRKKVRTINIFHRWSPLLMNRGENTSLTHWLAKDSGYYKPIVEQTLLPEERIDDLPWDWQEKALSKSHPSPKFIS